MREVVEKAYMEEEESVDWLVEKKEGEILETGSAQQLPAETHIATVERALITPMHKAPPQHPTRAVLQP